MSELSMHVTYWDTNNCAVRIYHDCCICT